MTYNFGDSFDLYATQADMGAGYWDSVGGSWNLLAGRFSGSRSVGFNVSCSLVKSSGANDAVHHLVVSFQQTQAFGSTTPGAYLQLLDGTIAQCSIIFRIDGAILLTSGGTAGTVLATYVGAIPAISTWYAFEFEIVIHPTAGSFTVRRNGNSVADFTATGLNTRVSANSYANKLTIGGAGSVSQQCDDLFWRSDASAVAWLGDLRCLTRMPVADASVQFSKAPTNVLQTQGTATTGGSFALPVGTIICVQVTAATTGVPTSLVVNFFAALAGKARMAIYDSTFNLLATSAELTNPGPGSTQFAITGGPTIQRGTAYWLALWANAAGTVTPDVLGNCSSQTLAYTGTFPATVTLTSYSNQGFTSMGWNITPFNCGVVNELQEDGIATYVYDSNPGDQDFYNIAAAATSTPYSTVAVISRGYMQKSDAGTRTAAVQVKSGGTVVASPTLTLTTSGWQWASRLDLVDPNTSAAWVSAAVDALQVGPKVVA